MRDPREQLLDAYDAEDEWDAYQAAQDRRADHTPANEHPGPWPTGTPHDDPRRSSQ